MRNRLLLVSVLLLSALRFPLSAFADGARTAIRNGVLQNNLDAGGHKLTNVAATVLADWGITDAASEAELANYVLKTTTVNGHALSANVTVTKSDVGLGNVDNTADASKPVSTAQAAADTVVANAAAAALASHTGNTSNPHAVTKSQVGLGNADNTSDANKPVSTAQQTALDAKVPTTRSISTISPLTGGGDLSSNRTFAINDAAADGSTKGASSFAAADFNATSGNISIDYANGQAASASLKGFLSAADWTTFNGKGPPPSDTAYNATSWDGVTTIAPSKNAVRDELETKQTAAQVQALIAAQIGVTLGRGGFQTRATSNGVTFHVSSGSERVQFFTGSGTSASLELANTTDLYLGFDFVLVNNASAAITVNTYSADTVFTLQPGGLAFVTCVNITNPQSANRWDVKSVDVTAILAAAAAYSDGAAGTAVTTAEAYTDAQIAAGPGYLVYTALISQRSTDAPTVNVLKNTLSGDPVWTYLDVGKYQAELTGEFTVEKTAIFINGDPSPVKVPHIVGANYGDGGSVFPDTVVIQSFAQDGTMAFVPADDVMFNDFIEIRVYP